MGKNILYFDVLSGISGDMTIGALLDLNCGITLLELEEELKKLNIGGYKLSAKKTQKNGITGIKFDVIISENYEHNHEQEHSHKHEHNHEHEHSHKQEHHHRTYKDIVEIIDNSTLKENVKNLSKEMFLNVGLAEAKVHNSNLNEVHFHEVGAIDSIVDIVGVAICIDALGVEEIISSDIPVGTGFVKSQHGIIPVPAPATLEILKGIPIYSKGIRSELVTPTGATIIKTLSKEFGGLPNILIDKVAYGHGTKDLEVTNTLRVVLGKKN